MPAASRIAGLTPLTVMIVPTSLMFENSDKIAESDALRDILVQVDVFPYLTPEEGREGYVRPALQGTEERLSKLDRRTFDDVLDATAAKTA